MNKGSALSLRSAFLVPLAAFAASLCPLAAQIAAPGRRVALVIGNADYQKTPKLRNPLNDAADVGGALERIGFEVISVLDGSNERMTQAVEEFARRLAGAEAGVFFYAGHGIQSQGVNYLLPIEADIQNEFQIRFRALDASYVLEAMNASGCPLNIVVLDACRDNPFATARGGARGLSVMGSAPKGAIIVYATDPGKTAADGSGRNGVFTEALLRHLPTPGIDVKEMLDLVGADVASATGYTQTPWISSKFYGSYSLAKAQPEPPKPAQPTPAGPGLTLTIVKTYGSLEVSTAARGTLLVDGKVVGELPGGSEAVLDNLESGYHDLELRHEGGSSEKARVQVEKGKTARVSFAGPPAPIPLAPIPPTPAPAPAPAPASSTSQVQPQPQPQAPAKAQPASASAQQKYGGPKPPGFTVILDEAPTTLDPTFFEWTSDHRIFTAFFEGLLINDPKTNRAIPGVAEKWLISKDLRTFTFTLRKSVWSDGRPVMASDFVKSWLRKLDPANAAVFADLLYDIVGAEEYNTGKAGPEAVKVKAIGDTTLEVQLKSPTPYFLEKTAHFAFAVVPMHVIEKHGKDWTKPGNFVGNGPFVLKEWKAGDRIVAAANPRYWDAKNVKLEQISFLPIDDAETAYALYKSGYVDWLDAIPAARLDEAKSRREYQIAPEYGLYYYVFNVTRKPLDDVRVRKALSMAFDRKALVDTVTKGGQIPATSFIPPSSGYTPAKGHGYNPDEARKWLAAAGFPNGRGFPKLTIIYNTSSGHKRIAEFIQTQWKTNLGVEVELVNQEWSTYMDTREKTHDFAIARSGWIADYVDPSTFCDMFETGSPQNSGLYSSKAYDAWLAKSRTQLGTERFKSLMEAEKVLVDEDAAVMPIYYYVTQHLIDLNAWGGWYPNPLDVHAWKFVYRK